MATHVQLGNSEPTGLDVPNVCYVSNFDEDATPDEIVTSIAAVSQGGVVGGIWHSHSTATAPDWVWSNNPDVEEAVAAHYGCARGVPSDVEAKYYTHNGPPGESA